MAGVLLETLRESLLVSLLISLRFSRCRRCGTPENQKTRKPQRFRDSRSSGDIVALGALTESETADAFATPSASVASGDFAAPCVLAESVGIGGFAEPGALTESETADAFADSGASETSDAFAASCVIGDPEAAGALVNFSDFGAPKAFRPLRILWWGLQMP